MKKQRPAFKLWHKAIAISVLIYSLFCIAMTFNQRHFIYIPFPGPIEPGEAGLPRFSRKQITDSNGTVIAYWESNTDANAPLLFYFHGNAGGLHKFTPALHYLEEHGYHVVAMEYRGYPGSPKGKSQENIVADGLALVKEFRKTDAEQKLIFWGYSLGSGIATQVAASYQPDVLVLEAPFTAVVDRAAEMFPVLPARYLIKDTYLSREAIRKLHMPVFIMHGDQDWIIPVHHGNDLYALANEPKEIKIYPGYGHLDLIHSQAYDDAVGFINAHAN